MGTRTAVHGCISIFIIFHCMQTIVRRMVPAVESRPTAVLYVVCPMKVAQKKELLVSFLALRSDVMLGVCSVHILPCDIIISFSCDMCTALFWSSSFFFFLFFFPLFLSLRVGGGSGKVFYDCRYVWTRIPPQWGQLATPSSSRCHCVWNVPQKFCPFFDAFHVLGFNGTVFPDQITSLWVLGRQALSLPIVCQIFLVWSR